MKVDIIDLHFTFIPTVESFELTDAIEVSQTGEYLVEVSFVFFCLFKQTTVIVHQ